VTDPRKYTAGTRAALLVLAQGGCYWPDCGRPLVVWIENEPVGDFHIAHIHGANRNSARYDDSMTDEQRSHFDNLLLLCKPHHDMVDRLHPTDYSVETLTKWKLDREGPGRAALSGLTQVTEERLQEIIAEVLKSAGPVRSVEADLNLGVLTHDGVLATIPIERWLDYVDSDNALAGRPVVIVTARNMGTLRVSVAAFTLNIRHVAHGTAGDAELTPRDPRLPNPSLPVGLDVGDSAKFLMAVDQIIDVANGFVQIKRLPTEIWGVVRLGTGEQVATPKHPVAEVLPRKK
jgi:hypothetical protein